MSLPALRRLTLPALLIGGGAIAFGWHLWSQQAAMAAQTTRFFAWERHADGILLLEVRPNPDLRHVVTTPAAPISGVIHVVGASGTVRPGDVVQVKNPRTGASGGAIADTRGGFALEIAAEAGDQLRMLAIQPPRVIGADPAVTTAKQPPVP